MRLQTAKHRAVRVFRAALTCVMFGLIGFLSWNFVLPRRPTPPDKKDVKDFSPGLSAFTEGLTFQHTEGDRTFYTLKAKTHQSFQDAPHLFRGVEVIIYGNETDPDRRIISDECAYDPRTGDIDFRGNVVAQLDETTIGRSSALNYKNKGRLVSTRSRVSVERPNEMSAGADSMEFGVESGLLKLAGKFHATLASGAELDSDAAVFHRNESWATVTGNVSVRSRSGWARGNEGRAELEPESFRPKTITIRGNVTAETRSASGDAWQITRADRLDLAMSPSGAVERAAATGQPRLEKRSASGNRTLTGGELVAWVDAHGNVERVEASQMARLEAGDGDRVTHLEANTIHLNPSGTIVTVGPSRMDSSDSTIIGRDFKIEQGDIVSTFATSFPATVDTRPSQPGGPTRHMESSKSTTASIDSKTNRLVKLVSTGSVRIIDGDRHGNADKVTVTEGGDTILLEGSATVIDPKTRIDGKIIEIAEKGETFRASGAVKTVTQSDSGPVTTTADEAHGSSGGKSEKVFYSGKVTTSAKTESGPLTIIADRAEGNSDEMMYTGKVEGKERGRVDTVILTESGAVRITALQVKGNGDRMNYAGKAELWRARDGVHMTSDVVDIWPKDKRFFAKGKVVFEAKEARGASDSLEYIESDDRGGTARYIGNVELTQKDMKIVASRVDTRLQEGRISEANAVGAVTVNQGASRGTGESAVYQAKDETITLTGRPDRPAVVTDPRGRTEGLTVTMDRSGKNASVSPDPTTGRVTTRVPVKP